MGRTINSKNKCERMVVVSLFNFLDHDHSAEDASTQVVESFGIPLTRNGRCGI